MRVRGAMVAVIAAIGGDRRGLSRRRLRSSVLDKSTAGRLLRQQREQISGRWQGPLAVPAGSVIVCVSLGSMADDLATELLVRILREQKIDARHMSIEDLEAAPPPNAARGGVNRLCGQCIPQRRAQPRRGDRGKPAQGISERLHRGGVPSRHAAARRRGGSGANLPGADKSAGSLGHAVQICLDMQPKAAKA